MKDPSILEMPIISEDEMMRAVAQNFDAMRDQVNQLAPKGSLIEGGAASSASR